jgi:hypothetical protein
MSLPPDRILVDDSTESPEDPLGFFLSENQKTVPIPPVPPALAVHIRDRRRRDVLRIASLVRFFAVIVAALFHVVRVAVAACASAVSSVRGLRVPQWRLPAWRLPMWRLSALRLPTGQLPRWQLPRWHLPARQLPRWQIPAWRDGAWRARIASVISQARQIAARTPITAVTVSAFACGVVVGGSVVWLSGVSRQATAQSTASQQTPQEIPRAVVSPVAPVATAFANTPVAQVASRTPAATAPGATRRPQFRGSLVVNSRPSGARVFVNGRSVGQTPLVLRNQPAGSRAIRVALDGYEPWSTAVQVVADTETRLRAELRAERPAAQP